MSMIAPRMGQATQVEREKSNELPANLTGDDSSTAEFDDLDSLNAWLSDLDQHMPPEEPPPNGEFLLDEISRKKLPPLYSGEELGVNALAQVKFFTPDSNWTWYASEFDGEDIFFGLVSGLEVELGYFSLKELQEPRGPLGVLIERDLHFEPKTLGELMKLHEGDNAPVTIIQRPEQGQDFVSFEEVMFAAKETILKNGNHIPTLILTSSGEILIGQIPDMPDTHAKRMALMYFLGELATNQGQVDQLEQVFLVSEGWMSMTAKEKQEDLPPSLDPDIKEVLIISSLTVRTNQKHIQLFEILRNNTDQTVDLMELLSEGNKDETVETPLLEAFVRGYKSALRARLN
jgi:hypothetical protein